MGNAKLTLPAVDVSTVSRDEEFAPFINIMSEWYAKDISKKVKTGIKTKGMSGKPIATEAPYGGTGRKS